MTAVGNASRYVFEIDGEHPNPEKVRAIIDVPSLNNIKQLQAFVGLCKFDSMFIRKFSTTLAPLYNLFKKYQSLHGVMIKRSLLLQSKNCS